MAAPNFFDPPADDELEVSVFGPGRGEGIALHIGGGRWITVDSCIDQRSDSHPLLEYLRALDVDIATQVELVVGTHAHDDHVAGISKIYSEATSAAYVTSAAFTGTEFFSAVIADKSIEDQLVPSVRREFRAVFAEAKRRPKSPAPIRQAMEERVLFRSVTWTGGPEVLIRALSPSDVAINRSRESVAEGAATVGSRARLAAPDPNEYTIALWIEAGDTAVLLGGDLLIGPEGSGWKRIAEFHESPIAASLFKVPHHGSKGAHYEPTWANLLSDSVVSVVAPFRPSRIPKDADVERIVERSGSAYITAKAVPPAPSRAVKRTKALLPTLASNVRERDGVVGHVQARTRAGNDGWIVRTEGPAHRLG